MYRVRAISKEELLLPFAYKVVSADSCPVDTNAILRFQHISIDPRFDLRSNFCVKVILLRKQVLDYMAQITSIQYSQQA